MSARSLRSSVRVNHPLHASLFKRTPAESAHGTKTEKSPHLRAPTRWCHSIILGDEPPPRHWGREAKMQLPLRSYDLLHKKLGFLNRRPNITRTATCTQSIQRIIWRILPRVSSSLFPVAGSCPLLHAALGHFLHMGWLCSTKNPHSPDCLPISTPVC